VELPICYLEATFAEKKHLPSMSMVTTDTTTSNATTLMASSKLEFCAVVGDDCYVGPLCVVQAGGNCTNVHYTAVVVCGCEAVFIAKKYATEAKRHISSVSLM